ncbi:sarcosine oxidase subunit gamma [Komagataeibacter sp. FNDCF1]|uniref:sarcosine oxidase subunit gamma n=1 Tax=Komagataeibacter sp. FNDCF1 TaxID=2878681 RepID=UPI001E5B69FC|nr:sarcosine oxidase subunit gamma family protein [Komagataeibacter sp. FNDCF1]MCE2564550.1 sarcosine oxidase gamma subunit [Komagataeibacter sp. FNDCF1]
MSDVMTASPTRFNVAPGPELRRWVLQGRDAALAAGAKAFGLSAVPEMLQAAQGANGTAVRLGPHELVFFVTPDKAATVTAAWTKGLKNIPSSLVEISDRQVAFDLVGQDVEEVLRNLSPLDFNIAAFPVGMATRTLLAKADGMLWRTGTDSFRLEVWGSFASYVTELLKKAAWDVRF